jgi:septation ring formation regulator EzrA
LIGRAKASAATKAKILACVSRKANALSCNKKTEDSAVKDNAATTEVTTQTVETPAVDPTLELKKELEEAKAELVATKDSLARVESELSETKDNVAKLTKDLDDTKVELKLSHDDLLQMSDRLVTAQEELSTLMADKVMTLKTLAGENPDETFKDSLTKETSESLKDHIISLSSKVDMKKIADSINSGLARNPAGTVSDPTGTSSNTQEKKMLDKASLNAIESEYMRILMGGNSPYGRGRLAADNFRQDLINKGILPTT